MAHREEQRLAQNARRAKTPGGRRKETGLPLATRPEPQICESCGNPPRTGRVLHLDHCHKTGAFRGWLCVKCNAGIGMLGDDLSGVLRAVAYLTRKF